jgi:hypothetical protein
MYVSNTVTDFNFGRKNKSGEEKVEKNEIKRT